MCLRHETLSLTYLWCNIHGLAETIRSAFHVTATTPPLERYTRWNNNIHHYTILNVDDSYNGVPIQTGFSGILGTHSGSYISGFLGRINLSKDILLAELTTLYQGLLLAINLNYNELVCYSDSLLIVNSLPIIMFMPCSFRISKI